MLWHWVQGPRSVCGGLWQYAQSLLPFVWQVKHAVIEFGGGAVTPGAPLWTSDA